MRLLNRFKKKFTFKNLALLFPIIIGIFSLSILYIHTKTIEIFRLLGNIAFFLLIYYSFTFFSQKFLNYDNLLFFFTRNRSIHPNLPFTQKDVKEISLGINLFGKLLLSVALFYLAAKPLRYIFTFMHEISHAIVLILYKIEIIDFVINIEGTSYVRRPVLPYGPITSNIAIAGSIGALLLGFFMIILLMQRKGIRIEIFLPLLVMISNSILHNINYWISGAIDNFGDAKEFLLSNPFIDSFQLIQICSIIKYEVILFLIIFFIFKTISMMRIRIYEIIPDFSLAEQANLII